jgi:hypothetical protein
MTARGKRTRPADVISARRKAALREALTPPGARPPGAALPDTRLPLRHTPNGYQMRHQDFTGARRLSLRTWSKGSARGEGPQQRRAGVEVAAGAPYVPCEACGSLRPEDAAGRHGAMPPTAATLATVADWPVCGHGRPYWQNCRAAAVVPPCCLREVAP